MYLQQKNAKPIQWIQSKRNRVYSTPVHSPLINAPHFIQVHVKEGKIYDMRWMLIEYTLFFLNVKVNSKTK